MSRSQLFTERAGNTFDADTTTDPKREVQWEVGDAKDARFLPQLKALSHGNEANLSVRLDLPDFDGPQKVSDATRVEWRKGPVAAKFYQLQAGRFNSELEFEVEYSARPASNVVRFTLAHKGLTFYYQPPLNKVSRRDLPPETVTVTETEARDARGQIVAHRPEWAVGSWAVYGEKTGNWKRGRNYGTGKLFHIPRPFIEDALGVQAWCDLDIDAAGNLATITIPQAFLDSATYPVRLDPSFGDSDKGTTGQSCGFNQCRGSAGTPSTNGTLDYIGIWAQDSGADAVKGLLTLQSTLVIETNGVGGAVATPTTGPSAAVQSTMGTPPSVTSGTAYVLFCLASNFVSNVYYDSGSSGDGYYDSTNNYATPTNPSDATTDANKYSIFGSYSETSLSLTLPHVSSAAAIYAPTLAPGAVTLTLPALASGAAIYAPTLAPGAVALTLPTIASGAAIYAPTIALGPITLSLPTIASTAALYAPTLAPGAVTLTLPHVSSSAALYAPTISTGVSITLPHVSSSAALYAPTIVPGAVTLTLPAVTSAAAIYAPTLSAGAVALTLPAVASGAAIYAPSLAYALDLAHLASGVALYAPTIAPGAVTLTLAHLASGATVYAAGLSGSGASFAPGGEFTVRPNLGGYTINAEPARFAVPADSQAHYTVRDEDNAF